MTTILCIGAGVILLGFGALWFAAWSLERHERADLLRHLQTLEAKRQREAEQR